MRSDGIFIAIAVADAVAADPEVAGKLAESCPVDIFAQTVGGTLELDAANVDECVLCRLCLEVAAACGENAVKVIKLYDGEALLA